MEPTDPIQDLITRNIPPGWEGTAVWRSKVISKRLAMPHIDVEFESPKNDHAAPLVIRFQTGTFADIAQDLKLGEVVLVAVLRKKEVTHDHKANGTD